MEEYESPKAEIIEFESKMILAASPNCACQDVTANEIPYSCTSGSLDNSYEPDEEDD